MPGSTLFTVWTHDRSGLGADAFDLGRDLGRLGEARVIQGSIGLRV